MHGIPVQVVEAMAVKFRAKPWKTGNSNVVTIDSDKIHEHKMDLNKEYEVTMEEVPNA